MFEEKDEGRGAERRGGMWVGGGVGDAGRFGGASEDARSCVEEGKPRRTIQCRASILITVGWRPIHAEPTV